MPNKKNYYDNNFINERDGPLHTKGRFQNYRH